MNLYVSLAVSLSQKNNTFNVNRDIRYNKTVAFIFPATVLWLTDVLLRFSFDVCWARKTRRVVLHPETSRWRLLCLLQSLTSRPRRSAVSFTLKERRKIERATMTGSRMTDFFSVDRGIFMGWKHFLLLAKGAHQHGVAGLCVFSRNDCTSCICHQDNHEYVVLRSCRRVSLLRKQHRFAL